MSFFTLKGGAIIGLLCCMMWVLPCRAWAVVPSDLTASADLDTMYPGDGRQLAQAIEDDKKNVNASAVINPVRDSRESYLGSNIVLYAGIFIVLMAGVVIVFLINTIKMRTRAQRSMQEMEQARQNFFTNVTHEFRTPLTVILGIADGLKKRLADRYTEAGFDLIIRQGNEMLSLVNQLLYISQVRSVVNSRDWRTGDIVAFLRMIVEASRVQASKALVDLEFSTSDDTITMDFAPEYMQKLIQSLFANSLKYTPRGGKIHLSITLEKKNVLIVIADSGEGIAEDDLPHVFDFSWQIRTPKHDFRTGIELTLVKQMTEAMDGKIEVFSTKGKGSKFLITLPQRHAEVEFRRWSPDEHLPSEEIQYGGESTASEEENGVSSDEEVTIFANLKGGVSLEAEKRQPTLLVIEDNVDIAHYMGALLENRYRLLFARDGKEGLAKAEEYMPDLILTDLMMPEMDGYELCRVIRASAVLNHIPVIIVTARCEEKDRLMGLEAGADAYLIKPFSTDELKIRIAKLLEQRRMLQEKYSKALQAILS